MKLRVERKIIESWQESLIEAGYHEIGGILYGEHVGDSDFRIVDITIQKGGGGLSVFQRNPCDAKKELSALNKKYGSNHSRFNYLGEWHSHPTAPAYPSDRDDEAMRLLLKDPETIANFLVLIIVRLNSMNRIDLSANCYLASGQVIECNLMVEKDVNGA